MSDSRQGLNKQFTRAGLQDHAARTPGATGSLYWIDKNSGIAQIPVKDAMKIIAEKGLPAVSAPPAEKKK